MITEKHKGVKYYHHNDLQSFVWRLNKPLITKKVYMYNIISDGVNGCCSMKASPGSQFIPSEDVAQILLFSEI